MIEPLHRTMIRQKIWKRSLKLRIWLADHFRGPFSALYSVLDTHGEVPVQVAAYKLVTERYLGINDSVLDVGFGLGYGMKIMATKADRLTGIEIDRKAIAKVKRNLNHPKISELSYYDGYTIPGEPNRFDGITCIDVLEHVPDYIRLLRNMCESSRRLVFISTPNRRPEYTKANGSPKNPWHLREWSYKELDAILQKLDVRYEWNFLDGPWNGPFEVSKQVTSATIALAPVLWVN